MNHRSFDTLGLSPSYSCQPDPELPGDGDWRCPVHGFGRDGSIAAEAQGIGRAALRTAVRYGNEREVFGRPIGMNQGLQFPLADSLARLDAAELVLRKATWLYDKGKPCAREANTAKYLCADAGFDAADRALQTHGGMGYSEEYHVARYFREARLTRIAPISQEMVLNYLGEHVLGLPRSY